MFKQIMTLLRGRAFDAEQSFADRNAVPMLGQQIRDAARSIQSARRAVAIAIAQNEQEKSQHAVITARLIDLEGRAVIALEKGNENLAREAADAIAFLEAESEASAKAEAQFAHAIEKLNGVVRASETTLRHLQRGERLARATEEAQRIDMASNDAGLATLDEAEETLARLRMRQNQNETTAMVLRDMDGGSRPTAIIERLANAGCGAPLRSSADDVLARLRGRMNASA